MSRDTQFAAFAMLLMKEIDDEIGIITQEGVKSDEEITEQEVAHRLTGIIARRAHDFMQHVVGYSLEYLYECGYEMSGGMNNRIAASIPDMRQWPEETK